MSEILVKTLLSGNTASKGEHLSSWSNYKKIQSAVFTQAFATLIYVI